MSGLLNTYISEDLVMVLKLPLLEVRSVLKGFVRLYKLSSGLMLIHSGNRVYFLNVYKAEVRPLIVYQSPSTVLYEQTKILEWYWLCVDNTVKDNPSVSVCLVSYSESQGNRLDLIKLGNREELGCSLSLIKMLGVLYGASHTWSSFLLHESGNGMCLINQLLKHIKEKVIGLNISSHGYGLLQTSKCVYYMHLNAGLNASCLDLRALDTMPVHLCVKYNWEPYKWLGVFSKKSKAVKFRGMVVEIQDIPLVKDDRAINSSELVELLWNKVEELSE